MRVWRGNRWLVAFSWLFASLTLLALLSQPGAAHDEWYHTGNIWCAQGVRAAHCSEIEQNYKYYATLDLRVIDCRRIPSELLNCPTDNDGRIVSVDNDLYPKAFYWFSSWFITPSTEISFFTIRAMSALVVSLTLGIMMWLLPFRHRLVLTLLLLTMYSSTGYYLYSSINPSSWALLGVSAGWLPLHAAISCDTLSPQRRYALAGFGLFSTMIGFGSRWDSIPFSGFMVVLVVSQALIFRLPRQKAVVTAVIFTIPVVSLYLLQRFSPLSPVDRLRQLVEFSEGQPDNVSFLTTNLIQGGLASLRALGSVPTATQVDIPGIVLILTVASLGALMLRTHNHHQKSQTLGCVSGLIVVGLVTAIHIEVLDSRDVGPIEPRYVLPLTSALVGWWFLHGPDDLFDRIGNLLRGASIVSTASFALMTFSISERFVDRQTYTLRLLPEGPDQWWWSWMPLSPNVPMLFAPIFFWFFVRGVTNGLMFNGRSMGSVDMP